MISYLKGIVAGIQTIGGSRVMLTLEVNGLGYDLQIPQGLAQQLPDSGGGTQIFTHLQIRDEVPFLYGFASPVERDLFRYFLGVSGIGPALAIALLDTLELPDLVQGIISGNTQILIQAPGVGKKTAERICLELKSKLVEWRKSAGFFVATGGPAPGILEEVQMTLFALGYTANEVSQALHVVSEEIGLPKDAYVEDWIKQAIAYLSSSEFLVGNS
ncbi:Holliday junction branch migration protein RuvA [Umezakia ovalisporum]|jgi:Holliday junction DNA helicase RuvA|uniref:Holliday junction branch migration complex subunit RuvA n=2 Tax=Umezakia ovalisporum TaxID=75695 RepID=A0AA43GY64_9CYAN|nr:Holliday junction branch migration protein RuvA [Umezakia ovalisporum]MDH6056342.1 Holliday junction branch migration protein RuvA [Umezakia ovalisporum FSS-43]MDH6063317.1 Holliday junction branch migration protein RuvA [Umezakia ovalisporum FSS-62]MDH6068536.1 Holliday junction branch migration protein RuvA [Umezakia ovalisporum APH033B]MDH6072759.1 Holliday junction branch migration protein RuvA [Umezakia ovalisporum CobakiLakeA]MDH6076122.1 Holliday junction branch migration protein Ruv